MTADLTPERGEGLDPELVAGFRQMIQRAPSPVTDEVTTDERDAFEAWYAADMSSAGLLTARPGEIKALRKGDTYGGSRPVLNGKWAGWKARSLLATMEKARD